MEDEADILKTIWTQIRLLPKAPIPQSLPPLRNHLATDFDCDLCNHCNCCSITGMVADQFSTFSDRLAFSRCQIGDKFRVIGDRQQPISHWSTTDRRLVGDWSATGWRLLYHHFLRITCLQRIKPFLCK